MWVVMIIGKPSQFMSEGNDLHVMPCLVICRQCYKPKLLVPCLCCWVCAGLHTPCCFNIVDHKTLKRV